MTKDKYQLIIWTLVTFAVGFFMWWVWIGTVICLMMLFEFGKNAEKKILDELDHIFIGNVKETDPDWKSYYLRACESPAEEQFLEVLIKEYDLKPDYGILRSPRLVCEMQFKHGRYRYDFLLNGRLIVEIDGYEFHSSPEAMERDRIRDEFSVSEQFTVLRIEARTVFRQPKMAISRVREALAKANLKVQENVKDEAANEKKSFFAHASESASGFSSFVRKWNDDTQKRLSVNELTKDYVIAAAKDNAQLISLHLFAHYLTHYADDLNNQLDDKYEKYHLLTTELMMNFVNKGFEDNTPKLHYEIPKSKWVVLEQIDISKIDPLYDDVIHIANAAMSDSRKTASEIKERCEKDEYYKAHAFYYLKSMGCPPEHRKQIIGDDLRSYSTLNHHISIMDDGTAHYTPTVNRPVRVPIKKNSYLSEQEHARILSRILDPFIEAINSESEQIEFVVDFADKMITYPDIYNIDIVSSLVWQKILKPQPCIYQQINDIVRNREDIEIEKRRAKIMAVQMRSCDDGLFCTKLTSVLVEMKCPIPIGCKLTNYGYKAAYFSKHQKYADLN